MRSKYFDAPRPRLFGHRGNSADFPENTLPAFTHAVASGLPYLELDIRATKDGEVVVLHDASLLRTCGVDIPVTELTIDALQKYDAGATFTADQGRSFPHRGLGIKVPTLSEVLQRFPGSLFNIEIKQDSPAIEKATLDVIRQAGMLDRVLLASENDAVMSRLRPLCNAQHIPTSYSYGELVSFFAWLQGGCASPYLPPAAALQIPETYEGQTLITPQTVAAAHALNLEIHVWTVNESADMERLLRMGVDGVMSDRPVVLRETANRIFSDYH
ncbi:MAG: glycerophosphodiester phosphodiesterase [Pedobacter sp.]